MRNLFIFLVLLRPNLSSAQTIYNLDKAVFSWTWSQGTGGTANGFRIKCGNQPKNYPMTTAIPDNTARTFPVKTVVGGSGNYYCVVVAYNAGGESAPSGETFFGVGAGPSTPGSFGVTDGSVAATQTKARAAKAKK